MERTRVLLLHYQHSVCVRVTESDEYDLWRLPSLTVSNGLLYSDLYGRLCWCLICVTSFVQNCKRERKTNKTEFLINFLFSVLQLVITLTFHCTLVIFGRYIIFSEREIGAKETSFFMFVVIVCVFSRV